MPRKRLVLLLLCASLCAWFKPLKLLQVFRIDYIERCSFKDQLTNDVADIKTFKIFIGAGTKDYVVMASHVALSLLQRSEKLVNASSGIYVLTTRENVEFCRLTLKDVEQTSCVGVTPKFQQNTRTHQEVYSKFESVSYVDDTEWVVYFDADTVILGELHQLMHQLPTWKKIMAVKDFPTFLQRLGKGRGAWGINGGFLAFEKSLVLDSWGMIESMMGQGVNDQIIWSQVMFRAGKKSCILGLEYNCRPNTHRRCHQNAKLIHYSSNAKHALYYYVRHQQTYG